MKKIINSIYVTLFLLVLLIPLVTMNVKKNYISTIDNKRLTEMPEFGTEGFTGQFELYLSERIGERDLMINSYTVLNDIVADELTHPSYTYGEDGYIFFKMRNNNIVYNDFHKSFAEMVMKIQDYCKERGTSFCLIFDPEKLSIYRRYLPEGVIYNDEWVDEMMKYMDELGINFVDNSALLTELSYSQQVFNRKYDAGHWNDLGCYYATNALLERIHEDVPEVEPIPIEMFDVSYEVMECLPNSEFKVNEEVPVFRLKSSYDDISAEWIDEIEINKSYSYFQYYVNEAPNAESLPKTLIFQGSYYNRNPQFFVSSTSEYIGIHNYQNILNFDYYYNIFQPDVVIFDIAEYVLSNTYFDLEGMKALDMNPGIINLKESFDENIDRIVSDADYAPVTSDIYITSGDRVDEISVDMSLLDIKYAYLISSGQVVDLSADDIGMGRWKTSVAHGAISAEKDALVYVVQYDGTKLYLKPDVHEMNLVTNESTVSAGVEQENDVIAFSTDVKDNLFNAINLQLYDGETGEFLDLICSNSSTGDVCGIYEHNLESGWYLIRLKANSNLQDEYVETRVYLTQGQAMRYSFVIDTLSGQYAKVIDYQLSLEKGFP